MRNHASLILLSCALSGAMLSTFSCAHFGTIPSRSTERPATLLGEAPDPPPTAVGFSSSDLPLPPVERGLVASEAVPTLLVAGLSPIARADVESPGLSLSPPARGDAGPRGRELGSELDSEAPTPSGELRGTAPLPELGVTSTLVVANARPQAPAPRTPASRASPSSTRASAAAPQAASAPPASPPAGAAAKSQPGAAAAPAAAFPAARTSPAAAAAPEAPIQAQLQSLVEEPTLYAKPQDELEIPLSGEGWILLGVQGVSASAATGGLRFLRRDLKPESTAFVFRAERLGEYQVSFQRQQLATGRLDGYRVTVRIVPQADLPLGVGSRVGAAAPLVAGTASPQPGASTSASPALSSRDLDNTRMSAERLFAIGLYQSSLEEYRKLVAGASADPRVLERIAQIQELLGNRKEAESGWQVLLAVEETRERAVAGLVRTAAQLDDGERVESMLDALLRVTSFPVGSELVEVARFADRTSRHALGLTALEEYLSRYPAGDRLDEVYYLLGRLLEKPWEGRDLQRSRSSYEEVVRSFPTSAFALSSGERIDYLKRHFYYVR